MYERCDIRVVVFERCDIRGWCVRGVTLGSGI